jgi:radical SAM protein with 4Fe4S-binding SPASM domain
MTGIRPRLSTLIYEVTQRCNHKCQHCYNVWHQNDSDYPRGELDTHQTLALLAKVLDETDCPHVTLTGGEPLLRRDLPQIVRYLHGRNVGVTIISNGRLLSEPAVNELLESGADLFELPLLSYRSDVHDALSGSPGAFNAVLAAMARLRLHGGMFLSAFVLTRVNLPDLNDTIKLAFAFGAGGLMLNRFNPGGRGIDHLDELLPSAGQVRDALCIAEAASQDLGFPISCSIPIQPCLMRVQIQPGQPLDIQSQFPHLQFGFCAAGTERAYYTIDPLGNLRPCNHTPTILGNLLEEPFSSLVAPERLKSFTSAFPPYCGKCPLLQTCQGGCKAAAQVCYGSLFDEEPFLRYNCGKSNQLPQGSSQAEATFELIASR